MTTSDVSRREAMKLAVAGASAVMLAHPAAARAPLLETRAPGHYTFMHGDMQLTVVSDGPLPIGDASKVLGNTTKPELAAMLESRFQSADALQLQQNALVVNTGDKLVLIDTGLGTNAMFGPQTGQLAANMRTAGLDPATIDAVLISHGHLDHVGGLVDKDGKRQFPNAVVHITKADLDFWTSDANITEENKGLITGAQKSLGAYKDRIQFIEDGKELVPGITAIAAPGHTAGHVVFMLTSGGKTICNSADIAHHPIIIVERPDIEFAFDLDKKQAVATRKRFFEMLAADRIPMLAYHFPWPGLGNVAKEAGGYRYHPQPMDMMPIAAKKG